MAADAARTLSERCVVCWRELCLYAQRFACPECNAMIHARCAAEHARWHQQQQQQQDPDATDHSMHEFLAADDAHGVEDADEGGVLYRPASAHRPASGSLDTMANPARPGAGSANAPGIANALDFEQYTTHMLPSRPQMPPLSPHVVQTRQNWAARLWQQLSRRLMEKAAAGELPCGRLCWTCGVGRCIWAPHGSTCPCECEACLVPPPPPGLGAAGRGRCRRREIDVSPKAVATQKQAIGNGTNSPAVASAGTTPSAEWFWHNLG